MEILFTVGISAISHRQSLSVACYIRRCSKDRPRALPADVHECKWEHSRFMKVNEIAPLNKQRDTQPPQTASIILPSSRAFTSIMVQRRPKCPAHPRNAANILCLEQWNYVHSPNDSTLAPRPRFQEPDPDRSRSVLFWSFAPCYVHPSKALNWFYGGKATTRSNWRLAFGLSGAICRHVNPTAVMSHYNVN